jgi:hypothetical protein
VLHRSGVSHSLPIVSSLFKKPIPGITFEILNSAVTLARLFKHFSVTIFPRKEKTRPTDRPTATEKKGKRTKPNHVVAPGSSSSRLFHPPLRQRERVSCFHLIFPTVALICFVGLFLLPFLGFCFFIF